MSDLTRSKLDVIYNEMLGDVHALADQLTGLQRDLPEIVKDSMQKLLIQINYLHETQKAIGNQLDGAHKNAILAIDNFAIAETKKMENGVKKLAFETTHEAIQSTFTKEMEGSLVKINIAIEKLRKTGEAVSANIEQSMDQNRGDSKQQLFAIVVVVFMTVVFTNWMLPWLSKTIFSLTIK